jgi:hypothetical protein
MEQGDDRIPSGAEDIHERRWSDHASLTVPWAWCAVGVAGRRPSQEVVFSDEPRLRVTENERAVREAVERRIVVALGASTGVPTLVVQRRVDRVGAVIRRM